ncbi:transmembrane protein 205 [Anopheles cruzii]|uniref:transmembrane protein 205 n=1 Tax=Anopheles cruzii TaxID=68878 RepID=UPI0022EC2C0C|nr:transmembrane protein 205 [Anopheles cruzii]
MCCIRSVVSTSPALAPDRQGESKLSTKPGADCTRAEAEEVSAVPPEHLELHQDILGRATRVTRQLLIAIRDRAQRFQQSTAYRILTSTTQPSHAITTIVTSLVLVALWPNLLGSDGAAGGAHRTIVDADGKPNVASQLFTQLAYLGSFTIHFGAQIWMTFVSGLALYFSLPRHTFGLIQEVLFPKYFALGTGLSTISLISFVELRRNHRPELAHRPLAYWEPADLLQIIVLALTAALELIVRLYLAPPMLRLMHEKHRIEAKASIGQEVGQYEGGSSEQLVRSDHYKATHKKFRQIHMTTAILNIVSLSCTCIHLLYLATKVNV